MVYDEWARVTHWVKDEFGDMSGSRNDDLAPEVIGELVVEEIAGNKSEEGEDDVKSSCPLCLGRHTCYNGRDKGSLSRKAVNSFPSLVHIAHHTMGAGHARSRYLNRKEGDAEGKASDWSEVITK
ncbi:hypothetical protein JHK85_022056 [Glycine max]|nr:hypothetical protein JHK85_022056 [Glycine max]